MDYEEMSNGELYEELRSAFHGIRFKPVSDESRDYVIQLLRAYDQIHEPERRK